MGAKISGMFDTRSPAIMLDIYVLSHSQMLTLDARRINCDSFLKFRGMLDTGATKTAISPRIVQILKLSSFRKVNVSSASGSSENNLYDVNVIIKSNSNLVALHDIEATEFIPPNNAFDVLIGMDIITQGDLVITHAKNGQFEYSFAI